MLPPFIAAMVVPTGIGACIGGHAGDATLAARLLAGACDTLLVHPNVVNAADLNEMPHNSLYVEGSMLDRFLSGEINLQPVRSNRILLVCNELTPTTINCANAARVLLGVDIRVLKLTTRLVMQSEIRDGIASGIVSGVAGLCAQLGNESDFDAVAIHTEIEVTDEVYDAYVHGQSPINPWGGVEAIVSRQISSALDVPAAHAPIETKPEFNEVVFPALSPELISGSMLFSVLKGLHKAPAVLLRDKIGFIENPGLSNRDVGALVSADCWGPPHHACIEFGIPVIIVETNTTNDPAPPNKGIRVRSYMEAVGYLVALQQGITIKADAGGGID